MENKTDLKYYLTALLRDLEFIEEFSHYHPEENVLVHSLQVFELAYKASKDPELWATALFHDVGKSIDYKDHANCGADLLQNLLSPRIVWLIRHHLDLLKHPRRTRKKRQHQAQLVDLEKLRCWDLAGRKPHQTLYKLDFAIDCLFQYDVIFQQNIDNTVNH